MEEDKKKKRTKKKKNKQTNNKTTADDVSVTDNTKSYDGQPQNHDNNNDDDDEQNHRVSEEVSNAGVEDFNIHTPNGAAQASMLVEAKKQQWLERQAALEETIKRLQYENDSHIQREATLEETIKQLRKENNSHIQKKATSEETVKQLQDENDSLMQKEADLEEKITHLRSVNNSCIQKEATFEETTKQLKTENDLHLKKEANLEMKIAQLQSEKDSLLQREAGLEEKLDHLIDEKAALDLQTNTTKETIATMNVDIMRLRMQVVELEESKNSLMKENQQLMENISGLQLQLQNIETSISSANNTSEESGKEDLNSQIEAACALVDKLITENSDLVEKVNELCIKLEQQRAATGLPIGRDVILGNSELANGTHPMSESSENASASGHKLDFMEVEPASAVPYYSEAGNGEIVQIPLDDNEQDLELQAVESNETSVVPISDAPLIGAPFRLISFVAKYVSGADLVNKDDSN